MAAAFLIAWLSALPIVEQQSQPQKDQPDIISAIAWEFRLLVARWDIAWFRASMWVRKAESDRRWKELTGMTFEEYLRDAQERRYKETPEFLKVRGVLYENIPDYAGPARIGVGHSDSIPAGLRPQPSRR